REELCRIALDEFRRVLAIDVDCLSRDGFDRLRRQSGQHMTGPWALSRNEPEPQPGVVFARSAGRGGPRNELGLSGRAAFGRYLRLRGQFPDYGADISVDD